MSPWWSTDNTRARETDEIPPESVDWVLAAHQVALLPGEVVGILGRVLGKQLIAGGAWLTPMTCRLRPKRLRQSTR